MVKLKQQEHTAQTSSNTHASGPVVIMAGGTGGHVIPGLALARELQKQQVPIVWFGTRLGIESTLVPEKPGIQLYYLPVAGLRGKSLLTLPKKIFALLQAGWQSYKLLRKIKPRYVVGMGGYVAGPGGVAARLLRIPLIIHEQNAVPGLTNKILAKFATKTLCAFPAVQQQLPRAICTGNPVRTEITALPPPAQRMRVHDSKIQLLILGGSKGAMFLNTVIPQALALLALRDPASVASIKVIHQCGAEHLVSAEQAYASAGITAQVVTFIADMAAAYGESDLVIARAGALTVAEIAACGVAAIFIPYPHAVDNHQFVNAQFLAQANAAIVLPQAAVTAASLAAAMQPLITDKAKLLVMAQQAYAVGERQALKKMVAELEREV